MLTPGFAWVEVLWEDKSFIPLENEKGIRDTELQGILEDQPDWKKPYYGGQISSGGGKTLRPESDFSGMFPPENMPAINCASELVRLIRPTGVHILKNATDGLADVGFAFSCKWDEEHGFGILTHQGKVLHVGDATASFEHLVSPRRDHPLPSDGSGPG